MLTLKKTASDHLRAAHAAEGEDRTAHLRATAETLVDARSHFYTSDGLTDWTGRSYAYKRFVGEVYSDAAVPREDLATLQASLRYHIGNALRDRLSPDELDALGLRTVSPRDRSVEKRARQARLLGQIEGGPIEDAEEIIESVLLIYRLAERVQTAAVRSLTAEQRRQVREALAASEDLLDEICRAAGRRRKETAVANGK
jgi:hypothetical protein